MAAHLAGDQTLAAMLEIWTTIFRRPVTADSDFFVDLDGDSMAAAAIVHWVGLDLGVTLPLADVFDHPTPGELAVLAQSLLAAPS